MTYEQVAAELQRIWDDEPDIHTMIILYQEHLLRQGLSAETIEEYCERWRKERPTKPEPLLDLWRKEPDQKVRNELLERWRKEK